VITVTGLGPGDLDRIPAAVRSILLEPGRTLIVRTDQHPAAEQLAALREVITCDDLYLTGESFGFWRRLRTGPSSTPYRAALSSVSSRSGC
jgi:uncharacterized protein YabN with tetrapyrrole methylase and pyrophosphatase domain